jgi:tRNA pseudouridine38-40 synthase
MLHQIRKMVSLAVLVERGDVPEDSILESFNRQRLGNIPPAPASGLFLDCLHFTAYNKRFADHLEAPIELESYEDAREAFKRDHIYPSILRRAIEEDTLAIFFSTVANHLPSFVEPE